MGHSRPRFNKQREEQMRLRREGKRKEVVDHADSGAAEIIIPKTKEEKEAERLLKELQQRVSAYHYVCFYCWSNIARVFTGSRGE